MDFRVEIHQHSLSVSPEFCKLESNTMSDWLNHMVYGLANQNYWLNHMVYGLANQNLCYFQMPQMLRKTKIGKQH